MKGHGKGGEKTRDISERKGADRHVRNFAVNEIETWRCQRRECNGVDQRKQAHDVPAERQPFSPAPARGYPGNQWRCQSRCPCFRPDTSPCGARDRPPKADTEILLTNIPQLTDRHERIAVEIVKLAEKRQAELVR